MNAVRVGLDALHFSRQTFGHPRPVVDLAVGVHEGDVGVRVDDARHPEVLVDALATALVFGLHAAGNFQTVFFHGPVVPFPQLTTFVGLRGLVLAGVQTDVDDGSGGFRGDFRTHVRFSTGGQLAVHDDTRDTDALLTSGLADGVETGTKQQLSEDLLDASLRNAGAVVFGLQFNDVLLVVDLGDLDTNFREDTCFLTSVQRVVHGFFDGRDKGTGQGIKPKEVFVFLKKFRNGDLLLVACHAFCGPCHGCSPPPVLLRLDDVGPTDVRSRPLRDYNLHRRNRMKEGKKRRQRGLPLRRTGPVPTC